MPTYREQRVPSTPARRPHSHLWVSLELSQRSDLQRLSGLNMLFPLRAGQQRATLRCNFSNTQFLSTGSPWGAELGDCGLGSFPLPSCLLHLTIVRFRAIASVLLPHRAELCLSFFRPLTGNFHSYSVGTLSP